MNEHPLTEVGAETAPSQFPTLDSPFELRLPNYEGPLDVLLRLIEEQQLQITAVSLTAVADQFIAYLGSMARRDPQTIAGFLAVAARLILIKSRALLPQAVVPTDDREETDNLVSQLRALQLFKRAAAILKDREVRRLRSFNVQPPPIPRPQSRALPLDNVTLEILARAMQRVVDRWLPPPMADEMVSRLSVTVNDSMDKIQTAVARYPRVTFTEMLDGVNTRVEIVVTLLGLLELLKRFSVRCYQDALFGEIYIEPFPEDERPQAEAQDVEIEFIV
jgi:segregation and condensation protein A